MAEALSQFGDAAALTGARRELLDLEAGTLTIETTRVVVDGKVIESDGKPRTHSTCSRSTRSPWPRSGHVEGSTRSGRIRPRLPGSRAAVLLGGRHAAAP